MQLLTFLALFAATLLQVNTEAVATFQGTLKSADKKRLVLEIENGQSLRMFVMGKTRFVRNGMAAKASDFHNGDPVTVDAERDVRMNMLAVKVEFPARKTEGQKP